MPRFVLSCLLLLASAVPFAQGARRNPADLEKLPYAPRQAICYRTATPIEANGRLDEAAWRAVAWSDAFIDIRGVERPRHATRMKMLWDDTHLYIAAELEEPDVWATLTARDSIIFADNDFEVFIDPDGDTHAYYELEVNALGTAWDLMLIQPYRDGGPAVHGWDIAGLEVGVDVRGTINRPGDRDQAWTIELALPWAILREAAPEHRAPRDGEQWRINFSRVQWTTDVRDRAYVKRIDPATRRPLPEDNWVWSPQGIVDMHAPERWGFVQFSRELAGAAATRFTSDPNDQVKWALRRLYYRQRQHRAEHGRYAASLTALGAAAVQVEGLAFAPILASTASLYEITAAGFDGVTVHIRQDGRVWTTRP